MNHIVGPNDKKATEAEPFFIYASNSDVESWGRVHKSINDAVKGMLGTVGAGELASYGPAQAWSEAGQRYSDLSDLDIQDVLEHGGVDLAGMVHETIADAKEGKRLLSELRDQAGVPGGGDTGGGGDGSDDGSGGNELKLFLSGAAVLALGYIGYKNWPRGGS